MRREEEAKGGSNDRGTRKACDHPLLANLYIEPDVEGMRQPAGGASFGRASLNYATPGDSQSRQGERGAGMVARALERLELTLNEKKTSLRMRAGAISTF